MKQVKKLLSLILVLATVLIGIKPMSIFAISEQDLKDIVDFELITVGKLKPIKETNMVRVFFEDPMASTSVTYATIGWTIKGTEEHSGKSVRIKNTQLGDIKNYPSDNVVTTVFEMSWDYIESRMRAEGYEDWAMDLATEGGIVHFDSIFTIKESGKEQGSISKDGVLSGETYTTYSGIANARGWDSVTKESLKTRFDIPLEFYKIDNRVDVYFKEKDSLIELSSSEHYILEDGLIVNAKTFDDYFFAYKTVNGEVFEHETSHSFIPNIYDKVDYEIVFYYEQKEVDVPGEIETEGGDGGDLSGEDLDPNVSGVIKSYDFDVEDGIPTTEDLYVEVKAKDYLYSYSFDLLEGVKTYPITFTKTYDLVWEERVYVGTDEDGEHQYRYEDRHSTATKTFSYNVKRNFSYYAVDYVDVFGFNYALIENYALPQEKYKLTVNEGEPEPIIIPELSLEEPENGNIVNPVYEAYVTLPSETIDGGRSRPSVPTENFEELAEASVGEILVANDGVMLGEDVVSSNEYVYTITEIPSVDILENNKVVTLKKENLEIDKLKKNGKKVSTGMIEYQGGLVFDFEVNSVNIHTPTVIHTEINDNLKYNQEIYHDDSKVSVILDRPAKFKAYTKGEHRDIKGYGDRDYSKYIEKMGVFFPFDVYFNAKDGTDNTKYCKGDEPIYLDKNIEEYDFYVPTWVDEGDYIVRTFTFAINQEDEVTVGENANLNMSEYIAYDEIEVHVSGRLYGMKVTDFITDFIPNVQNEVTEKIVGMTPERKPAHINHFPVGVKTYNGQLTEREEGMSDDEYLEWLLNDYTVLPIIPGSSKSGFNGELDKGYAFAFEVETIGSYAEKGSGIYIKPNFYHVDLEGNKTAVDLYVRNKFENVKKDNEFMLSRIDDVIGVENFEPVEEKYGEVALYEDHKNMVTLYDNYRLLWDREKFKQVESDLMELGYSKEEAKTLFTIRDRTLGTTRIYI